MMCPFKGISFGGTWCWPLIGDVHVDRLVKMVYRDSPKKQSK